MRRKIPIITLFAAIIAVSALVILFLKLAPYNRQNTQPADGWGDNAGGRPGYTLEQINKRSVLGEKIVFNSIIDNAEYGHDERKFLSVQSPEDDRMDTWQSGRIAVEVGKKYIIRLYMHNDNPRGPDAIAENTMAAIAIPQITDTQIAVAGFISVSNAEPSECWDTVNFYSKGEPFQLRYIYGSAKLYNDGIGKDGYSLEDKVVTEAASGGQAVGVEALDGRMPGGTDAYLTIEVAAVFETGYITEQKVRLAGTHEWINDISADVGDEVEFQIEYRNASQVGLVQDDVMLRCVLPDNLQYIPQSTKLWNSNHSGGVINPDGALFGDGINLGSYEPEANAFVRFSAIVVDRSLEGGSNSLVIWAQCGVGKITIQDYACVVIQK